MDYFEGSKLMCPNLISIQFDNIIISIEGINSQETSFLDTLTRFDIIQLLDLLWRKMYIG